MKIEQFTVSVVTDETGKETINTSGNMTLNGVASALVKIAFSAGQNQKIEEVKKNKID